MFNLDRYTILIIILATGLLAWAHFGMIQQHPIISVFVIIIATVLFILATRKTPDGS